MDNFEKPSLCGLPWEMLDNIMLFIPQMQLCELAAEFGTPFIESLQRIISKDGLQLCANFKLREHQLLWILQTNAQYISRINLNHCYWLSEYALGEVLELPMLRHLHVLECKLTYLLVKRLMQLELDSLSITWNDIVGVFMKEMLPNDDSMPMELFHGLKYLEIFIPPLEHHEMYACICRLLVNSCSNIEALKIFKSSVVINSPRHTPSNYPDRQILPKLIDLHLNLHDSQEASFIVDHLFCDKREPFKAFNIGNALPVYFLEDWGISKKMSNMWECYALLPKVSIRGPFNSYEIANKEVKEIESKISINCKEFEVDSLHIRADCLFSKIADICINLKVFSLSNCIMDTNTFLSGLEVIADRCKSITQMDLKVYELMNCDHKTIKRAFLSVLLKFKGLKTLHLSPQLICSLQGPLKLPEDIFVPFNLSNKKLEDDDDMGDFTFCCKNIELVIIARTSEKFANFQIKDLVDLLSGFPNLKELCLVNTGISRGEKFLSLVAKTCSQLSTLDLNTVNILPSMVFPVLDGLQYAKGFKSLTIKEGLTITRDVSTELQHCVSLERLHLGSVFIIAADVEHLCTALKKLPNLVAVIITFICTYEYVIDAITMTLKSLQRTRPALSYIICQSEEDLREMPDIHLQLRWPKY